MRSFAFDCHGCVAIVEEVWSYGKCYEAKEELLRSTLHHHIVCRKARINLTACYCVIYACHTYIDDE